MSDHADEKIDSPTAPLSSENSTSQPEYPPSRPPSIDLNHIKNPLTPIIEESLNHIKSCKEGSLTSHLHESMDATSLLHIGKEVCTVILNDPSQAHLSPADQTQVVSTVLQLIYKEYTGQNIPPELELFIGKASDFLCRTLCAAGECIIDTTVKCCRTRCSWFYDFCTSVLSLLRCCFIVVGRP